MPKVYALTSDDNVFRYIGQTTLTLDLRLRNHVQKAKRVDSPFGRWILSNYEHETLRIVMIEETADADVLERVLIRRHGPLLFNIRRGGRFAPQCRNRVPIRPICIEADGEGVLITCPSLPEVTTFALDPAKIIRRANDAIEEALYARRA